MIYGNPKKVVTSFMKPILLLFVLSMILVGCNDKEDKELELEKVIQQYKDSMLEKDVENHKRLYKEGVVDVESAFKGNNFFSFETVNETIDDDQAVVRLKCEFEELQVNNEYMNFIGYLTLYLEYGSNGWLINDYDSEIDPSTPRPVRP